MSRRMAVVAITGVVDTYSVTVEDGALILHM
jgi:hypothetical protein